jgi:hypothetical protein
VKPTLFLAALVLIISTACSGPTDWQRKDAFRRCETVINDWSDTPAPPCEAMFMCANEAPLSPEARGKLARMIAATPGCEAP